VRPSTAAAAAGARPTTAAAAAAASRQPGVLLGRGPGDAGSRTPVFL
jgi:hypothetical protein